MSGNDPKLTPRELEVLAYLTAGTTNREIATELAHQCDDSEGSPQLHLREAPCVKPNRGGARRLRCLPHAEGLRELALVRTHVRSAPAPRVGPVLDSRAARWPIAPPDPATRRRLPDRSSAE